MTEQGQVIHKGKAKITPKSDKKPVTIPVRLSHIGQLHQIWERRSAHLIDDLQTVNDIISIMRKYPDFETYYKYAIDGGWRVVIGNNDGDHGDSNPTTKLITFELTNVFHSEILVLVIAEEIRHAWQFLKREKDGVVTLGDRKIIGNNNEPIVFKDYTSADILYHNIIDQEWMGRYENHPCERDAKIFGSWICTMIVINGRTRFD